MKINYINQVWTEFIKTQKEITKMLDNFKIKSYYIEDEMVRYSIKEWLEHNGIKIECEGNEIKFL